MTNLEPVQRQQLIELADLVLDMEDAERASDSLQALFLRKRVEIELRRLRDLGVSLGDLKEILDERRRTRDAQREESLKAAEESWPAEEEKRRAEAARQAEDEKRRAEAVLSSLTRFSKPDVDPVDAAVFCPPRLRTESRFLVQVYIYEPSAAAVATMQAREADAQAARRGTYSFPLDIPLGTRVDVRLEMEDLEIAETDAVIVWRGRITSTQFEVVVPATKLGDTIGRVRFAVSGIPAGTLRFKVEVVAQEASVERAVCEANAVRYRRAFASYSSEDRLEVLHRLQAFRIAGISVFQDVLDLDPGQRWERAVYREIDLCDVFLLFWSRTAAASEWVAKEIDYALNRKGGDDERPPAIQPVPIEGPPPTPPPAALRHLHFNDALLPHIKAASAQDLSKSAP
jgi:DNA-binding transcriptional MerR regulator